MRHLVSGLLVVGLMACVVSTAGARCGDQPGDTEAVSSVVGAIINQCGCCRPKPVSGQCAFRVVAAAVQSGSLRRRCAHAALRRARLLCARSERPGLPCRTTTTTLPPPACTSDGDCDDGSGCTADACVNGRCQHVCRCFGPGGSPLCCPGPAATCLALQYYYTCGGPVCRVDPGASIPGVPRCTTQQVGGVCPTPGAECDPGVGCGVRLLCTNHDPKASGCPISARSAKRDITYLTPADVRRLRDDLMRLRLATYQYRSEGASGPRRLGFVIDDVGQSPAIAPGGTMVDVYGYASMAVAALQAQGKEIDRLKGEMETLRRECRAPARR